MLRRDFAYAHFLAFAGLGATDLGLTGRLSTHSSTKGTTSEQRQGHDGNPSADINIGYQYSPVPG